MHRPRLLYAASILLIAVCDANSPSNAFHFDDSLVIENDAYIRSLRNVPRFFTDAHTFSSLPSNATYRPLVSLTLAIDYALGKGLDPRQFHVTQILLMVILFLLIAELFRCLVDDLTAIVAATWFAIHTVNTETMNLISARLRRIDPQRHLVRLGRLPAKSGGHELPAEVVPGVGGARGESKRAPIIDRGIEMTARAHCRESLLKKARLSSSGTMTPDRLHGSPRRVAEAGDRPRQSKDR